MDLFITHHLATPLFLHFKSEIRLTFVRIGDITKCIYFSTAQLFETLYEWYNLWEELRQLQPCRQQYTQLKTDCQLIQTSPPYDKYIIKIRQQWIPTPFTEQATAFQDLWQDFQVSNTEYSLDLHVPNVSLERIHSLLVVYNDCTFTEFINGEERCLKFVNQDLTFLQVSHIPLTFANVSHIPMQLKEPSHITLPIHSSKENNNNSCTHTIQPTLGFTLAEIPRAQDNPTLMVPQLLKIKSCKDYVETHLQTLDGLHVTQVKRFLPLTQEAKKLAEEFWKEEIASQWAGLPPEKLLQESFVEQLNALQSLAHLALLTAAKEHLPGDIINILEHLGKVDNIPFNQLYRLAEDCAGRYYTKVIQTLTHLMKNSFHDRQLVLVNTARVLKFLESYAA